MGNTIISGNYSSNIVIKDITSIKYLKDQLAIIYIGSLKDTTIWINHINIVVIPYLEEDPKCLAQ